MTTARTVIQDALSFHLNRLSPGETLDADTASLALSALNSVVDAINGGKSLLWRETTETATVTGTGTLGTTWAGIAPGAQILGATYNEGDGDQPISLITMQQWAERITIKTTGGVPQVYAHDGAATVYFYPAPVAVPIALRFKQAASEFAALDTDYVLPAGWRSGLSAMLAETLATVLIGGVPGDVARKSAAARLRLTGQSMVPGVILGGSGSGNILNGWE